jgi:hypothetical protein
MPYPALLKTTSTSPRARVALDVGKRRELSSFVGFRIVATTVQPRDANRFAEARPSPEEVPAMQEPFSANFKARDMAVT